MVSRKVIGIVALFLCFYTLEAQSFATRQLEYLSGIMRCALPQQSGTFYCQRVSTLPLLVEYDNAGAVSHLGVAVFSEEVKEMVGKPVCDFQERLFLEVFLQGDEAKARKLLGEYKVDYPDSNFGFGSFYSFWENSLRFASQANEYGLIKDSLTWRSVWSDSMRAFSLHFPSNFDLILGMDKKEAEIWLATQLQNYRNESPAISTPLVETGPLEQLNRSVYVKRGKNQFVHSMNGNLYFSPDEATCTFRLLYDPKFVGESISNLFNRPDFRAEGLELQIKQLTYGGESQSFKMRLSDFQHFMSDDFEVFTGIEKSTADTVEFTVMYKSKWYNCFHLLHVQTSPQHLFDKSEALKANLSAFIPNHNITNLYNDEVIDASLMANAPASQLLFKFACDTTRAVAHNDIVPQDPKNPIVYEPVKKINEKEYALGLKTTKVGNACAIVGGVFTVGGFVGLMCTDNASTTNKIFRGFMYGGAFGVLIGNIAIDIGNRKMNSAISVTQNGIGLTLKF